jgi:hypothetical protein
MKNNRNHAVRGGKVLSGRRKTDSPFVPPRVVVPETQSTQHESAEETQLPKDQPMWKDVTEGQTERPADSDSEGETQLPKDQPPYIPENGKDFVPVSSIFLEERTVEDEDDIPVAVVLERQKDKLNTKCAKTATSSDDDDDTPVTMLLQRQNKMTGQTPTQTLRDNRGEIVMGERAIGVGIAKIFQDLGMFTGIVDRVRKEGRETLYHVSYADGDEEELSTYEYVLACQLFEILDTKNVEDVIDTDMLGECECEDSGSDYSDTDDRRARKNERKAMLLKRKKKKYAEKESTARQSLTKSKRARLKEKTSMDKSDVELFGGKNTLTTNTWNSLTENQQCSTLTEMEKPLKTKMKKTLQDQLLQVCIVVTMILTLHISN